jgi:hypothetical protein
VGRQGKWWDFLSSQPCILLNAKTTKEEEEEEEEEEETHWFVAAVRVWSVGILHWMVQYILLVRETDFNCRKRFH